MDNKINVEEALNQENPDFKWTEGRIRRLITLVKANRHLWHNSAQNFTGNPSKRVKFFIDIANDIGTTAFEANRRFTSLRERYGKESKKEDRGQKSTWPYYADLSFLNEVIRRRSKKKHDKNLEHNSNNKLIKIEEKSIEYAEISEEENSESKETTSEHNSVFVMEHEETLQQSDSQEEEIIETALKFLNLELKKMDQKKREYCIDKIMLAFINAKSTYPN